MEDPLLKPRFATALVVLVALLPSRGRAQGEAPVSETATVALVDAVSFITAGVPKAVNERERFFASLRKKLGDSGWATVVHAADPGCAGDNACLAHVAQAAAVPYVLRVSGEGNLLSGYTMRLAVYAAATGHVQQAAAFCDICITDRMAGIAADFARGLLADAIKDERAVRQERRPSPATPQAQAETIALLPHPAAEPPPSHASRSFLWWLSWGVVGAGVAGMAYGGWALHEDGKLAGDTHVGAGQTLSRDRYASNAVGATTLAVGAGLTLLGVVLLVTDPVPRGRLHVSASDGGLGWSF